MTLSINDVTEFLTSQELQFELAGEKTVVVSLPGTNKQFVNVAMTKFSRSKVLWPEIQMRIMKRFTAGF
jgi:hypothetical protein